MFLTKRLHGRENKEVQDVVKKIKRRYLNLLVMCHWPKKKIHAMMGREFGMDPLEVYNLIARPGYNRSLWK